MATIQTTDAIDFKEVVTKIRASARCSKDEAWTGLATAWLYLDQSRTLNEQYWFLINIGAKFVRGAIQAKYSPQGEYSVMELEHTPPTTVDSDRLLYHFDEGPVRDYATAISSGLVTTVSLDSVRAYLRKYHKEISNYENCKKVLSRYRICAERVRQLARILHC